MRLSKKTLALAAIPAAFAGWALFRPELLFINQTVNEQLPTVAGQSLEIVSKGDFASGAHETRGKAEVVRAGGKPYLRLSGFHTSNGPDVRVILLKKGASEGSDGSVDLGSIKGNIGDQNYALPKSITPDEVSAVSIWCQRFSVGFGRADLEASMKPTAQLGSQTFLAAHGPITVTKGSFKGDARFGGTAAIVEDAGTRTLNLSFSKLPGGDFTVRLVKQESLKAGAYQPDLTSIDLGRASRGLRKVPISRDIDAWLYRSVAVLDGDRVVAFVHLRSSQEKTGNAPLA
jgi:hypothetical protein